MMCSLYFLLFSKVIDEECYLTLAVATTRCEKFGVQSMKMFSGLEGLMKVVAVELAYVG